MSRLTIVTHFMIVLILGFPVLHGSPFNYNINPEGDVRDVTSESYGLPGSLPDYGGQAMDGSDVQNPLPLDESETESVPIHFSPYGGAETGETTISSEKRTDTKTKTEMRQYLMTLFKKWLQDHKDGMKDISPFTGSLLQRNLHNYNEYVYSLRAIPYLFKKRLEDDKKGSYDSSMGFLFKRSGNEDDMASRAILHALFKRDGVPFLFKRNQPFFVSTTGRGKSEPFIFKKYSAEIEPEDDKGIPENPAERSMEFLFRRGNAENIPEQERHIIQGLF